MQDQKGQAAGRMQPYPFFSYKKEFQLSVFRRKNPSFFLSHCDEKPSGMAQAMLSDSSSPMVIFKLNRHHCLAKK